jgi:hypothetical protein
MTQTPVRIARGGTIMWKAWVGFNFSHSLGAVIFGVVCCWTAVALGTIVVSPWVLFLFVIVALMYLGLSVLYWFRIPTLGIAIATGCLSLAWFMYAFFR